MQGFTFFLQMFEWKGLIWKLLKSSSSLSGLRFESNKFILDLFVKCYVFLIIIIAILENTNEYNNSSRRSMSSSVKGNNRMSIAMERTGQWYVLIVLKI